MTLFAALTTTSYDGDGDVDGDAAAGRGQPPSSSSSSPPEVIQLHTALLIDFLDGTIVDLAKAPSAPSAASASASASDGGGGVEAVDRPTAAEDEKIRRPFSALSYQAVQTRRDGDDDDDDDDDRDGGGAAADRHRRRRGHPRPDLGVWDCRVDGGAVDAEARAATLLRRVAAGKKGPPGSSAPPTVLMAVDLSDPSEVQPAVERMRNVVLGAYDRDDDDGADGRPSPPPPPSSSGTTSMRALRGAVFGRASTRGEVPAGGTTPAGGGGGGGGGRGISL
jgi:hypothetical protein